MKHAHPTTYQGLREHIEGLAAVIASANDQRAMWALVISEMFAEVLKINAAAQAFLDKHENV